LAKETRSELVALHVIEKPDDSDFFMSSVALLEGSPFPVNEFPTTPADVLLQEGPSIFGISSGGPLKEATRSRLRRE
jgi:hypothetical protein